MPRALVWRRVPELSVARLCRSRTADLDRRGTEVVEAYGANSYRRQVFSNRRSTVTSGPPIASAIAAYAAS